MSVRKITIKSGNEEFTLDVTEEEYRNYFRPWWQQKKHEQKDAQMGQRRKNKGVHSDDLWRRKMRCQCGHAFAKTKWHTKTDFITYTYKCYDQTRTGTIAARLKNGLSIAMPEDGEFSEEEMDKYVSGVRVYEDRFEWLLNLSPDAGGGLDDAGSPVYFKKITVTPDDERAWFKKHPQWSKSNRYAELEAWIFI